jgi:hypothetical protein
VIAGDAIGTIDLGTGTVDITLAGRGYLALGKPTVCRNCDADVRTYGDNSGGQWTTTKSAGTTLNWLPEARSSSRPCGGLSTPLTGRSLLLAR